MQTAQNQILCLQHNKSNQNPNLTTPTKRYQYYNCKSRNSISNHMQIQKLWCTVCRLHNETTLREIHQTQNYLQKPSWQTLFGMKPLQQDNSPNTHSSTSKQNKSRTMDKQNEYYLQTRKFNFNKLSTQKD